MVAWLHVHSDYSILDGGASIWKYGERAVLLGQSSLVITDHGTIGGAYEVWNVGKKYNLKPIIGLEAYIAPFDRTVKEPVFFGSEEQKSDDVSGAGAYLHITLLAYNANGVRNLFRLQHDAYSSGFYKKPRIDLYSLSRFSDGIVCLTGCPSGHLQTLIRLGKDVAARDFLGSLKEIFPDRLFIELMDHGLDMEKIVLPSLIKMSQDFSLPMVATPDCHYCDPEDATAHDALLCIQTKALVSQESRFKFTGDGYHFPTAEELIAKGIPMNALVNTNTIAEMVESYDEIFERRVRMPHVPGIDPENYASELQSRVFNGLYNLNATPDHFKQATFELSVISGAGYPPYFLALQEVMDKARAKGIRFGPARGSAAGAVTTYATRISSVDPLKWGLMFERFLNVERLSLPDIDIDVQDDRRDEFIEIAREYFGDENVAQIVTYGTIGAKSALKDIARVLGYSAADGQMLANTMPPMKFGRAPGLKDYPTGTHPGLEASILPLAKRIEGLIRSSGVHASGIIVSPEPLTYLIPTKIPGGKQGLTTELTGTEMESLGFTKYDFLGLRTMAVIDRALKQIGEREGRVVELPEEFDDDDVYRLLSAGDTTGIFQLESPGMRNLLRKVRPGNLTDIASVLALYRPGPMGSGSHTEYANRKNGRSPIDYPHPEFAEDLAGVLSETYGVIVFQEQILRILAAVGGYTYASAELIFNAMRKKDTAKMLAAKPEFEERLKKYGYSRSATESLWNVLIPFADYSFNKSHSVSYAMISYYMAWLMCHYPWDTWAAILTCETDPKKLPPYIKAAMDSGVPLLPPDINESGVSWTVTQHGIRYGIASVQGISATSVKRLKAQGPFRTIAQFWERIPDGLLNLKVAGALIKSGSLDSLEPCREGLVAEVDALVERARAYREQTWGALYTTMNVSGTYAFSINDRKLWEQETLGVALSEPVIQFQLGHFLTPEEWLFVLKTLDQFPGRSPIDFYVSEKSYIRGYTKVKPQPRLFEALAAMGITRV